MITGSQIRAARAILRWTAEEVATAASVGVATVRRAEAADFEPVITVANAAAIRRALEGAGIEFIAEDGGGDGVRRRDRRPPVDQGKTPDELTSENDG